MFDFGNPVDDYIKLREMELKEKQSVNLNVEKLIELLVSFDKRIKKLEGK